MYKLFIWQGYVYGGAARITREVAYSASDHGVEPTIGMFADDPTWPGQQLVIRIPKFVPPSFRSFAASLIFRLRYAKDFNGVYTHTLGAWRRPKAHLFVHDAADLDRKLKEMPTKTRRAVYWVWRYLYLYLCLRQATLIFAASSEFANYLARRTIPQNRVVLSGSFYDNALFRYVRRPTPAVPPYNILFIGDYTDPAKRFAGLRTAIAGHQHYILHVAGGPAHARTGNIIYYGYVGPSRLYKLLAQSHIFVLPSSSEGFSVALLEALATGIPCLISPAAIPPELDGIANIVLLPSPASTNEHIEQIIQDFAKYSQPAVGLDRYTKQAVLAREWAALRQYVTQTTKPLSSRAR